MRRTILPSLLAALAVAAVPSTASAATCKLPADGRGFGPTYVTSLKVTKASCATGKAVVKDYYRCRLDNGGKKATCEKKVAGFRCREARDAAIPTQFDAVVTCTKGAARVVHRYTQFT